MFATLCPNYQSTYVLCQIVDSKEMSSVSLQRDGVNMVSVSHNETNCLI